MTCKDLGVPSTPPRRHADAKQAQRARTRTRRARRAGHTDAQIAEKLFISVSTVRTHLDRIRDKSGRRRWADLTRLALQDGII